MTKKPMSKHDADWLEAMYNNRARVPEHAEHFRRWAARSADAMRSNPREMDIRYGGGPRQHLDVFPTSQPDAPVIVFIHGGWWRSLDKRDHSFIAPSLTKEGACVVLPNYALAPAVTIPQIAMQMVEALAWTWRNIARHGGDPSRITVIGHSAGGHLAAMMLSCLWQVYDPRLPADLCKGALSISGLYDLEPIMHTPFLQESLKLTPQQVRQASPALFPPPAQGRLYTVAGALESEEFLRNNQLIRKAWGAQKVPVCEELPGLNHFSVVEALADPAHRLHELATELAGL